MTPLADVPQIVIDGAWLVAALTALGTAIGTGVRYGFKAAAAVVVAYLSKRDAEETRRDAAEAKLAREAAQREDALRLVLGDTTVAITQLKGAVTKQGEALAAVVDEVRNHRHDLNGLAHVAGLKAELDRLRAERREKDRPGDAKP